MRLIILFSLFTILGISFAGCTNNGKFSAAFVPDSTVTTRGGVTYYTQKTFTGKTFLLDQHGDTISVAEYENGKMNGVAVAWYSMRSKKFERYYVQGRKEGIHLGWWPNGQLKFRYEFKNDEYEGSVKEWYEDGSPYRSFTYSKGYENGSQKMWRPDGIIYANYVVKNNRIYGLSGRKNCKSLWKS